MDKRKVQMSESLGLGIVLAVAGGFMDAYSYICRGKVFANAQTGNILLFGVNFSQGAWFEAFRYLIPVIAFGVGIALAEMVRVWCAENEWLHWRQIAVLFEGLVLMGVCFIPQSMNLLANSLISFACGIQVESFRKIKGNAIATTMCIGNLRSATQHICMFWHTKNKELLYKSVLYYGIILCFAGGAIIGNLCIRLLDERALLICAAFLLIAFLVMFINNEEKKM